MNSMCLGGGTPQPAPTPAPAPAPPADPPQAPILNQTDGSEMNSLAAGRDGTNSLKINLKPDAKTSSSGLNIPT